MVAACNNSFTIMKPTPEGWPRLSIGLQYDDCPAAIDFLCRAFGFEVRLKVEGEGGRIEHSELVYGGALVMAGTAGRDDRHDNVPPKHLEGKNTCVPCLFVDDADAHCERARKEGARILNDPETSDYGEDYWTDRSYRAVDSEGHQWWFMQRVRG